MSQTTGIPYNNRFRSSSGDCSNHALYAVGRHELKSVSQGVGLFEHSPPYASPPGYVGGQPLGQIRIHRMTSFEHPIPVSTLVDPHTPPILHGGPVMCPGKPRRLSRQTSAADVKRQLFAFSRNPSGEGPAVTSQDSTCDEVFVEVAGGGVGGGSGDGGGLKSPASPHPLILPDTSLFRSKRTLEVSLSTSSSSTSGLPLVTPNPYNRINRRIHGALWCCNCIYLLFFCCLPAIHYMEQGDVEYYSRHNHKRARCLGLTASFFFFTGTLIALSFLTLVFFLAIFFAVY
ncbi:uncharacterized protein LOC143301923 [Babylonia areolata]|uniref:uncharacterized protein LOC143301923 n=1 Tax=Babylonia areolata TaxID=304850 RepID=UPI003FD17773